jgi:hypothetical protein
MLNINPDRSALKAPGTPRAEKKLTETAPSGIEEYTVFRFIQFIGKEIVLNKTAVRKIGTFTRSGNPRFGKELH